MNKEIKKTIQKYLKAYYEQDFDTMIDLFYEEDKIEFSKVFVEFAEKMDIFGETDDLLKRLGLTNIAALKKLTSDEFITAILKMVTNSVGEKELKRMIKGIKITGIDEASLLTIVRYQIPFKYYGEWDKLDSDLTMIYTNSEWKIFFKSGLRMGLQKFQNEIDLFYERKAKDQIDKIEHEGDLTTFTITGYKNLNGDIVIEPRFKEAGEFHNGLASVQIIRKYGYINLKGEIAIKPQFDEADDFSENLAAVRIDDEEKGRLWGFINKKGKMVIEPIYDYTAGFSEGLCVVSKDEKYGHIDKKGKVIIPLKFTWANDFDDGTCSVELINKNGETVEMVLDKKGNLVE